MATKTIYQTLEDRKSDKAHLEKNGPYPCRWENSWLGDGYYFWDTFIQNAHWWGKEVRKYPDGYIICEATCDFNDTECLDLHGNMEQLKMFQDSYEFLRDQGKVDKNTTVKKFLAIMKGQFPRFNDYAAVRVNGIRSKSAFSEFTVNLFFERNKNQYFEFIPAVQICFYRKTSLNLRNYKIIYPPEYGDDYLV